MEDLINDLRKNTSGEIRFDKLSRILYSTDASIYEIEPLGVVIPRRVEDIQATIEIANKYEVPIIPRGGGTSIVGNSIGSGIILDCSKYLNKVLEVNKEENWVRVQPGVVLDGLNAHLREDELFFGPDVASSSRANLGGMIGNNSSGAHSVVYGKTVDHVQELEVALANGETTTLKSLSPAAWKRRSRKDGFVNSLYQCVNRIVNENRDEIDKRFPKIMRRVAGYNLDEFVGEQDNNLAKLIVGSEGTLAVVTEARLNLVALCQHSTLAVVFFNDLFAALDSVAAMLEFSPSAVELLDSNILDMTRSTKEFARKLTFVQGSPAAVLLVEFQGNCKDELIDKVEKLAEFLSREKIGYDCYQALEPEQQADIWYIRQAGLGLLMGSRAPRKPIGFVEDCAVAPERLPDFIRRFDEIVRANGTDAAYYAHASVGCLHIRPKLNLKEPAEVKIMAKIADEVSSLALEFGGTISGEHGDGLAHSCWNEKMFGKQLYRAFGEIKQVFDPKNILNPGKIVNSPFLTENFRRLPQTTLPQIKTVLDFSEDGGLAQAIELCNGNAFCRKKDGGAMCPSYMVTLEEEHSTRGRANALRALLTGKLDENAFTDNRLRDVLEFCVACKACKGECPANVDMAKIKYEFLYHYHKVHGLPMRDRLFGHIATMSRLGSAMAPLSNKFLATPRLRWLLQHLLGISSEHKLPQFVKKSFVEWFKHRQLTKPAVAEKVVLFNDTFMTYNYPEIGQAAVQLLEAAGFEVVLPEKRCCGRPFISRGMLDEAKACASYNINKLYPFVVKGYQIIGCEPSCILTFREEYPYLVDDERARLVAENTLLIEEFFTTLNKNGALKLSLKKANQPFLLHEHCHAKALVGTGPAEAFLKMIPNAKVEVVDSGCCGMAGSFGFEQEHYQISQKIGKRSLYAAVEAAAASGSEIVTPGISCRQQIEHGTGKRTRHPVEVVAEHL